MKLKTKIVLISCASLIIAALLCELIIITITSKTRRETIILSGYQTSQGIISEFQYDNYKMNKSSISDSDYTYLDYYFKTINDNYIICIVGQNDINNIDTVDYIEIYNHTVFTPQKLDNMDFIKYENLEYCNINWEGREYLIFKGIENNINIYKIIDISYLNDEIKQMFFYAISVNLIIALLASIILSLILKKILNPLQKLNDATKVITNDFCGHRVFVERDDEIGELSKSFNKMLDAIDVRTKSLEDSEKKKTMFMANLAHELKTPMTSISGYSQTLLSTKLSEEDQEEALCYIYQECNRLETLSRKMMRLLEIDYEKSIELKEIPVLDIFNASVESTKVTLRNKNINIEIHESGEKFNMDYDLMIDAIINLINNGVKASSEGGVIKLIATDREIIVEDFGKGIPKEEIDKIQEPFYMVDKSRNSKSKGTGLGLSLISIIAQKHNAKVIIKSELNIGTKVILQFV